MTSHKFHRAILASWTVVILAVVIPLTASATGYPKGQSQEKLSPNIQVNHAEAVKLSSAPENNSDNGKGTVQLIYMAEHCQLWYSHYATNNYHVLIDDNARVELTRYPHAVDLMQCIVTFAARKPNQRLLLHFESMDINYNPGTIDRLHIFDGDRANMQSQLSPSRGLYGKYFKGGYEFSSGGIHDYQSMESNLTLYFEGTPTTTFSGFKAMLTVFTVPFTNGSCEYGDFRCKVSGLCISDSLVCNNYQNCGEGDNSDNEECQARHAFVPDQVTYTSMGTTGMGLMVGCAISIVILMVVVLWLGIVCLKRSRSRSGHPELLPQNHGPNEVEGTIVEPVQPRNVLVPVLSFYEPPPLYSESSEPGDTGSAGDYRQRFEPPPPYSLEDTDTAMLIMNECPANQSLTEPLMQCMGNGPNSNEPLVLVDYSPVMDNGETTASTAALVQDEADKDFSDTSLLDAIDLPTEGSSSLQDYQLDPLVMAEGNYSSSG